MKKLPKIYQNDLKKIKNNLEVYDSLNVEEKEIRKKEEKIDLNFVNLTVKDKINKLINQNSYIFNTKVILVYDDYEEETLIAGVVNDHIITMDNKIVKIADLKDLKILEK